jgi:hypothetical protein
MNNLSDNEINEIIENVYSVNDENKDDIVNLLKNENHINILWGVQPRNLPNLEFLIPIIQLMKFLKYGYKITILLADVHELLDSPHLNLNILKIRCDAYKELISQLIELFDVNPGNITYVYGSEFQTSHNYVMDIYKISSMVSIKQAYNSREIDINNLDISLNSSEKKMTKMLYPILQSLDEKYTECDVFYGSTSQENICKFSSDLMNNFRKYDKKVVYLLQDLTKKINISFFDPIDCIVNKLEYFDLDIIYYLSEQILFPILKYKNDKMIFEEIQINDHKHFITYINEKTIEKNKLIEIISKYLSKYLDKFYDNLIRSNFSKYYNYGWIGFTF